MTKLSDFAFLPLHFDAQAEPVHPDELDRLLEHVAETAPSDILVLAHGWNNDLDEAHTLYERLLGNLRDHVTRGRLPDLPVVGMFWPSKRFTDPALISGGAASFGQDAQESALERRLDALADALEGPDAERVRRARDLVIDLEDDPSARDAFVDELRSLLPSSVDDDAVEAEPPPALLQSARGRDVLDRLARPLADPSGRTVAAGEGGATSLDLEDDGGQADPSVGEAAGLGDFFRGVRAAALRLANMVTYYTMKRRAGLVGRQALAPVLDRLAAASPGLRVHLVGHSFGGRLVTAAAAHVQTPVQSLSLLQAAFSHHGLAQAYDGERDGAFRSVLSADNVRGPVLVTHTASDRAVGYAYPLASRLAGQTASGLGDASDPFGGIGRNGAQSTPEALHLRLEENGHRYLFKPGRVHNLLADGRIADHGDVHNADVAAAVAAAIASA